MNDGKIVQQFLKAKETTKELNMSLSIDKQDQFVITKRSINGREAENFVIKNKDIDSIVNFLYGFQMHNKITKK